MAENRGDYVREASQQARRIGAVYMTFLAYSALTVWGISDRQLVMNEVLRLPIVGSEVPVRSYFLLSPIIIAFIFCYFHIHLHVAKRGVEMLESECSENAAACYPWIVYSTDFQEPGFIGHLQKVFVGFSLWWSLPLVMALFLMTIIKKHDTALSCCVCIVSLSALLLLVLFHSQYPRAAKLRFPQKLRAGCIFIALAAFHLFVLVFLIPAAGSGRHFWGITGIYGTPRDYGGTYWSHLGSFLTVDLRRQIIVQKPQEGYQSAYWAELADIRLEGADLSGAILTRANLRRAHLQRAWMTSAVLSRADLSDANVAFVMLNGATLEESCLGAANFAGAFLQRVSARKSFPTQSNFNGADLGEADFEGADFYNSCLEGACLVNAKVAKARFLNANLRKVVARNADFAGANLEGAFLDEADLTDARNLTIEQLSKAGSLFNTKLAPDLREELEKTQPRLLKKPDETNRRGVHFEQKFPGYDKGFDYSGMFDFPDFK